MPFNGAGTFNRVYNWVQDRINGIKILSARMDEEMDGMATGLSTCITKDGQTTITANLPMGGFKHTGVADASARTQYAAAGQVQDSSFTWCGTAGGTADAITLSPTPAITAYAAGQSFTYKSGSSANTGAMTVAISGLTTKAIQKNGSAMPAADHPANRWFRITYDGTAFQLEQIETGQLSALLSTANTWTAAQSITVTDTTGPLTLTSTDAGASAGPNLILDRNSATPANSDVAGSIQWKGRDSGAGTDTIAQIEAQWDDVTAASEDARVNLKTVVAGTLATRGYWAAGLVVGSPTSGDMGAGKINTTGYYVNGVASQCVLDRDVTVNDVVSSNAETTVYSYSIPANTLGTNRMIRLTLMGDYLNNTGNGRALTVNVKLGSTTVAALDVLTLGASASRRGFELNTKICAFNSATAQMTSTLAIMGTAIGVTGADVDIFAVTNASSYAAYTSSTEDSTGALTLAVTITHAIADANLSFRCNTVITELV